MSVTSALVLYAVIWFLVLFVTLPLYEKTQGEAGKIVPGTHSGAPANLKMKRVALIVSGVALVIWGVACGVIVSGVVTIDDLDIFSRWRPSGGRDG